MPANGFTPLQVAAAGGALGVVKIFVARGANPMTRGKHGKTAVELAREYGKADVVAFLTSRSS
jgi:ankyrin repeat protein